MALQLPRKENKNQQDVDPTESLTKALASFKQVLKTEQRKKFEDSTTVPDAGSVLFFVAQLDAENASKTRRSIAPRLCTFLTATQQFAGAVETFVSSHPETAALIWGGIKTAITVASNVASYFDKVTNMIKDIGITCPTIQQFGQLYHGHVGLQRSLCDYYSVIIELCSKVIEVSRRPAAIRTFISIWNPFESEFNPCLERLASSKDQVMLQISLASEMAAHEAKMLLEYESKKNSSHRASALKFFKRSAHHQEEARQWQINQTKREKAALKIQIRQNLSPVDHIPPWKRILKQRVQSTAEWVLHEDAFLEWKASPESSILWCSGTMGMGKTVLMSNVVSFLHSARRENDSVAHFFCQADNQPSLSARNIVGSICRQLLDSLIEGSSHKDLLSIEHDCEGLDTNETIQFLLSKMVKERMYYIVLDGIDECEMAQIREMARALEMLSQGKLGTLKIICAGRPGLEVDLFKWRRPQHRVVIDQGKLNVDMERYIAATLYDCLEDGELVLQDKDIITTIADALLEGSHGMFLWAGLCIRDLCEKNCDEDILDALKHLPRGLAELFDSKIRRIQQGKDSHHAIDLLQYCGVVKRPLTIEEYREALSISLGDKSLNTKRLPNDMNRIVRGCFGLTFIDDEEHTIHYTHHSVKEHLFHTKNKDPANLDAKKVNEHFGVLCMTYLNFTNFSRQVVKAEEGLMIDPLLLGALSISSRNRWIPEVQSS
ncbi:uncharacterized protein BO72DRAFT_391158 [Aspergillus fijiensis CBS 313.89]|uniref:NACHT domain-containing protein n=1 Tax=Aspergillus fijiensis CBS 313.89 TaxID=1448319 RepID=A0A8G1RH95_9EURO|nr:uncharacterized protein BO72DRAFT_391158 [Aspergillus fijiensis CBS 313.89]RAK71755.1 hypothetical protein BO72DRAFT_391158 [Aspergillus fijiensis CBS 313.89]